MSNVNKFKVERIKRKKQICMSCMRWKKEGKSSLQLPTVAAFNRVQLGCNCNCNCTAWKEPLQVPTAAVAAAGRRTVCHNSLSHFRRKARVIVVARTRLTYGWTWTAITGLGTSEITTSRTTKRKRRVKKKKEGESRGHIQGRCNRFIHPSDHLVLQVQWP